MGFKQFIDDYIKLSGEISIDNEMMNGTLFFAVMGALLNRKGITIQYNLSEFSPLIHVLHIQDSRTGKGISLKVMRNFAGSFTEMDEEGEIVELLETKIIGEATDAGLVGIVDPNIHQRNSNKGLLPGDEDFLNPITYGALATKDLICFPEAEEMFMTGPHKEGRMKTFQLAIDGIVSKTLGASTIEYDCNATIIGTSYFLKEFEKMVWERGIFQRLYITNLDLTPEQVFERNRKLTKGSGNPSKKEEVNADLDKLAKKILKVVNNFNSNTILSLNETGEDALLNILDERESYVLRDFIGKELRLVLSYISAINVLYVKMGAIAAVLNGRDIITHEEIEQVDPYVRLYWKSVVMDILSRIQNRSLEDIRKSIYTMLGNKENKEGLSEKELKNTVKIKLKCSSRSVNKVVDDMKKNKELLTKKDFVKLNSKR